MRRALQPIVDFFNTPISELKVRRPGELALAVVLGVILLVSGFALAFGLLMSGGAVALSSNPEFCITCHQIEPLYHEWRASTHKSVNCLECHAPPGPAGYAKIVTNGSGNVLAQMRGDFILPEGTAIDDASCLACHQRELRPEVLRQATLKVAHAKHTEQKCTDCHARLVHPRQFQPALQAQLGTHAPKDCQVCHPSPAPAYLHGQANLQCDSCHSGTIPNHDLARKVGTMLREDCLECHNRLRVADPAACQVCHVSPHGIDQNCAACHASTKEWTEKAFAHPLALKGPHSRQQCTQCHGGSTFQAGKFNCASCHKLTHGPLGDNCTTCHKPDAWKPLRIDHAKAWNGYLGKHAAAACTACHATGQYKGTPTDCKACHRPPEKHFGDNCATCHKPEQPFKPPRQ